MSMTVAPEDVILGVLQEARKRSHRRLYRTALVKLVYLVDYIYAQHSGGRTLTGLDYIWDSYGPNASHNEIVQHADTLEKPRHDIKIERIVTPAGNPTYLYEVNEGARDEPLDDALGQAIISDVVAAYGGLNWAQLVRVAKGTRPFHDAKQGQLLNLQPDGQRISRLTKLRDGAVDGRYDSVGTTVTAEELKARYGLDT